MFGNRLSELRKQNNLTQKELAEKFDLTPKAISFYELGQREPDIDTVIKLAEFFHVTTDYLLGKSSHPQLSRRNELDIEKELEDMKKQLEEGTLRMDLGGEPVDEEIMKFIIDNMENTLILAKIKAKEKFTPKKYRK